jgi:DNA-binding NtrC family response regulator
MGAVGDRRGAFAEADGGTLFLDEIGELALDLQPALLRALDKRTIRPVGATVYQNVNVRIVAATNRNLRAEVAARRFREDLYYRLAVIRVGVPPLRERPDDLELLTEHFIREFARRPIQVTPADRQRLRQHGWPGNVRELRNVIERACLLGGGRLALDEMLAHDGALGGPPVAPVETGADLPAGVPYKQARNQLLDGFERTYFQALIQRHGGNLSAAAREAQIDRKHLRELLRKYGLLSGR